MSISLGTDYNVRRAVVWLGGDDYMVEYRPQRLTRPTECERSHIVRTDRVEVDGACRNFELDRIQCVFCMACPMSAQLQGIPFDAREYCDRIMGW